jgi:NADH-quinone oxidoreductase subunit G
MTDATVLGMIVEAMGQQVGAWDVNGLRRELGRIGAWSGARAAAPSEPAPAAHVSHGTGSAVVSSWRALIDAGTMQEGEPYLAATARLVAATLPATTLAALGMPQTVTVAGPAGSIVLPAVAGDVADGVVHLPMRSVGCSIHEDLGVRPGELVTITAGGAA